MFIALVLTGHLRADHTSVEQPPEIQIIQELIPPGKVAALSWSSDGTKLAAAVLGPAALIPMLPPVRLDSPFGKLLLVWNADGSIVQEIRRTESFFTLTDRIAFVANDKQIAAPPLWDSKSLAFSVYDLASGETAKELLGPNPDGDMHKNRGRLLIASPDQSVLALAYQTGDPVALYSTRDWTKIADLPQQSSEARRPPHDLSFSENGDFLAVLGWGIVRIYSVTTKEVARTLPVDIFAQRLALSPDGRKVAVAYSGRGTSVQIFNVESGAVIATQSIGHESITELAWSPDGRFVAFVAGYRKLHLWNALSSNRSERIIDLGSAMTFAFSPDGRRIAATSDSAVTILSIGQAP